MENINKKIMFAVIAWCAVSTFLLGLYGWKVVYTTQYQGELQCFTGAASDTSDRIAWQQNVPQTKTAKH